MFLVVVLIKLFVLTINLVIMHIKLFVLTINLVIMLIKLFVLTMSRLLFIGVKRQLTKLLKQLLKNINIAKNYEKTFQ